MGRRRSKILQELKDISGTLPWWMMVPIALGTYVLLHRYAVSDPAVAVDPDQPAGTALPSVLRELAAYAQYVVPWLMVVAMLSSVLRRATGTRLFAAPPEDRQPEEPPLEDQFPEESPEPTCPRCKGRMVRRTAQRGRNVGNDFWGCSRFPACHGTRDVDAEEPYSLSA